MITLKPSFHGDHRSYPLSWVSTKPTSFHGCAPNSWHLPGDEHWTSLMQSPMGCAPSSSSGCSPLYPDPTHPSWEVKSGSTPTGPPPGGGHISWVLTRPSWSAHLWMPTRMLTFVSRSHSPSWEDGSGCTPGRHPLRLHLAHLVITAATFCIYISLTWPLLPHIAIWLTTAWLQWRWAGLASCHTTALTCYQTATQ